MHSGQLHSMQRGRAGQGFLFERATGSSLSSTTRPYFANRQAVVGLHLPAICSGLPGCILLPAAPGGSDGEEPPTKRHSASDEAAAGQREAAAVVAAAVQRPAAALAPAPVLMSPEATAAALGDAALAAAADAAGVPGLEGAGGVPNLEIMHSFLTAAYGGAQQESSDESEPDI